MNDKNFSIAILVDRPARKVFNAINDVRGWWSKEIEGDTDKLDEEFTYRYKDVHHCKIKVVEVVQDKKVVWLVLDNYFSFIEDKTEWIGTKIIFKISEKGNKTEMRFTHLGLVPEYECYDICFDAWSNYIKNSLHSLITSGKGQPNAKEDQG